MIDFAVSAVSYQSCNLVATCRARLKVTGCTVACDGWTNVNGSALLNIMVVTPQGPLFLRAVDTSGNTKTAEYIADEISKAIQVSFAALQP